jgi:hypothetical protein
VVKHNIRLSGHKTKTPGQVDVGIFETEKSQPFLIGEAKRHKHSRNPDREILAAGRPCLATTGGTLFAIGSPHARKGETWGTFRKHFGPNGNPAILVANGPDAAFQPDDPAKRNR